MPHLDLLPVASRLLYALTVVAALVATVCACVAHYRLTRM